MNFRDQLLIWTKRAWIIESGVTPPIPSRVREAFLVAGIPRATKQLNELLTIIRKSGFKDVYFQPMPCQQVSEDEKHFLLLLNAAGQRASEDFLLDLLLEWLPAVNAARALEFIHELACSVFSEMKPDVVSKSADLPETVHFHGHCPDPGILRVH